MTTKLNIMFIKKIKDVNGRLELIRTFPNNVKVYVDFAHTPDALKTVISNIKEDYPLSKISLVFGCGGDRDKSKRPQIAKVVSKYTTLSNLFMKVSNSLITFSSNLGQFDVCISLLLKFFSQHSDAICGVNG